MREAHLILKDRAKDAGKDAEPSTVIQDCGPRAECRDTKPSSMIQNGGKGAVCRDADSALQPVAT